MQVKHITWNTESQCKHPLQYFIDSKYGMENYIWLLDILYQKLLYLCTAITYRLQITSVTYIFQLPFRSLPLHFPVDLPCLLLSSQTLWCILQLATQPCSLFSLLQPVSLQPNLVVQHGGLQLADPCVILFLQPYCVKLNLVGFPLAYNLTLQFP